MSSPDGSRAGFETARLKLARLRLDGDDVRASGMRELARIGAQTLTVERAGVWMFEDEGRRLRNVSQYVLSRGAWSSGDELDVAECPAFLGALRERRVVAAPDARTHPLTQELAATHLDVYGISSRLDASIIREGNVVGVVSFEHVGPSRLWTQKDRDFAASTADIAALLLEQADRMEIQVALYGRREEQLAEEKMAALALLARSVAHDLNNVLNALSIIGFSLEQQAAEDLRRHGSSIGKAVGLGARLIEQLSLFSSEAGPRTARVDLARVLERMRPVLSELMRGARLEIDVTTDTTSVLGSDSEMEQIVLNLCVNAAEAVDPATGIVRISLRDARPDEPLNPAALVLTVEDNGSGMDAETLDRAFEPYFTRKGAERGIGLSVVYGIVRRARGTVSAQSTPGVSTVFTVALPRAPWR